MVCTTLGTGELVELDLILADPLRWPVTVWGAFSPPEGGLPATYRKFGAQQMGREWLMAHGYDIPKPALVRHIDLDVPVLAVDVDELVQRGLIALSRNDADGAERDKLAQPIDPLAFVKFYNAGITLGIRGLELLQQRVDDLVRLGEEVPLPLVKMIVDAGLKLATSQAAIKSSGKTWGDGPETENDGFRGGDDISPRFGSARVRQIDGVATPVFDEGPTDRKRYNERARQEGMPPIGGQ